MTVIGITGTIGAGKGAIVEYLGKRGFRHYSAREFIVAEIKRRGMPVNRDTMAITANDLRASHSPSFIVESLYKEASAGNENAVIESIRAEGEVTALRKEGNFWLVSVDADQKIRYERVFSRGNETDHISFEKFLEDENKEMHSTDPSKQNIAQCIKIADFQLTNNGTIEELDRQVDQVLAQIEKRGNTR